MGALQRTDGVTNKSGGGIRREGAGRGLDNKMRQRTTKVLGVLKKMRMGGFLKVCGESWGGKARLLELSLLAPSPQTKKDRQSGELGDR